MIRYAVEITELEGAKRFGNFGKGTVCEVVLLTRVSMLRDGMAAGQFTVTGGK